RRRTHSCRRRSSSLWPRPPPPRPLPAPRRRRSSQQPWWRARQRGIFRFRSWTRPPPSPDETSKQYTAASDTTAIFLAAQRAQGRVSLAVGSALLLPARTLELGFGVARALDARRRHLREPTVLGLGLASFTIVHNHGGVAGLLGPGGGCAVVGGLGERGAVVGGRGVGGAVVVGLGVRAAVVDGRGV